MSSVNIKEIILLYGKYCNLADNAIKLKYFALLQYN